MSAANSLPSIVLAAGESSRMGRMKPLLPLGSRTVLQRVADILLEAGAVPVIVVVGHRADEVASCLEGRPVTVTRNDAYRDGMLSSAQRGALLLPPDSPAFLLALGDQPGVTPRLVRRLIDEWNARPGGIVVPSVGGRRGHPMVVDARLLPDLLALRPPATLRDLIRRPGAARREVDFPPSDETAGLLVDLDTPEDYADALRSGRYHDRNADRCSDRNADRCSDRDTDRCNDRDTDRYNG